MLPERYRHTNSERMFVRLNAPTGAWCSLTSRERRTVMQTAVSQCTYRCVVLPDARRLSSATSSRTSQCTYRCVVLPDSPLWPPSSLRRDSLNAPTGAWCSLTTGGLPSTGSSIGLNAPTGAWCSLTRRLGEMLVSAATSQCTYRCVVLPDGVSGFTFGRASARLNAPTGAWCSLTRFISTERFSLSSLNAPTGAWCSLTPASESGGMTPLRGPGAPPAPGAPLRTGQHRA